MAHEDPFLAAQSDILSLLQQSRTSLSSYLRIRRSASSASTPELVEARQDLEDILTDLSTDLQDLVDSVKAVEGDPYRYGLDIDEVSRRRKLVSDVGNEIHEMRRRVNQTVEEAERKRSNSLRHPDDFAEDDPLAAGGGEDDGYAEWEEQRQMEIMHEQDEALDGVFQTVGNLRAQADTMGRELEEQVELLQDAETITDRVGGKLAKGMKGIRHVIERNEGECAFHPRDVVMCAAFANEERRQVVELFYCAFDRCAYPAAHPGPRPVSIGICGRLWTAAPPQAEPHIGLRLRLLRSRRAFTS